MFSIIHNNIVEKYGEQFASGSCSSQILCKLEKDSVFKKPSFENNIQIEMATYELITNFNEFRLKVK